MQVTIAGELRELDRIDVALDPVVGVKVYYRAFLSWVLVQKIYGPLCDEFSCPVERGPGAAMRGSLSVPSDAPSGWYRIVFTARQNATNLFCVDAKVKFRA